ASDWIQPEKGKQGGGCERAESCEGDPTVRRIGLPPGAKALSEVRARFYGPRSAMRIIHTATAYYPSIGGAQLHWFTIGQGLRRRGHEVAAIAQWIDQRNRYLLDSTLLAPWDNDRYAVDGIEVQRVQPTLAARCWMAPLIPACIPIPELGYPPIERWFANQFARRISNADVVHNIRIGREHFSW